MTKLLAFAGSLRDGSWNHKLIELAAAGARGAGAHVTVVRLRDYPMPIYNADDEAVHGLPEHALRLKRLLWEHQGLLIACPEYNSSLPAALKNAIDWVSRPGGWEAAGRTGKEPRLSAFADKVAGIMSTSPGVLGGLRGLAHLRSILTNMTVLVLPEQIAVPRADQAFTPEGALADASMAAVVERIGATLAKTVERLKG